MQPDFEFQTTGARLQAALAPWDCEVFGFPVAQVVAFTATDARAADEALSGMRKWAAGHGVRLVSCRLAEDRLAESFALEQAGFRFIEMVLHPVCNDVQQRVWPEPTLSVEPAQADDVPSIRQMAAGAFRFERLHADPRLDTTLANERYARWVENTLTSERQQLLKICDGNDTVAFFIVEETDAAVGYWHLTAVAPDFHGQGYGRRSWLAMLAHHRALGHERVSTTISARNVPVLNLYSQLQFRFLPPEMSFHWMADSV